MSICCFFFPFPSWHTLWIVTYYLNEGKHRGSGYVQSLTAWKEGEEIMILESPWPCYVLNRKILCLTLQSHRLKHAYSWGRQLALGRCPMKRSLGKSWPALQIWQHLVWYFCQICAKAVMVSFMGKSSLVLSCDIRKVSINHNSFLNKNDFLSLICTEAKCLCRRLLSTIKQCNQWGSYPAGSRGVWVSPLSQGI